MEPMTFDEQGWFGDSLDAAEHEAAARGLRLGCAPDTFLSSAYEAGRELIERGEIGRPLGATARFLVGGPDNWHPNADMFYKAGGGPMPSNSGRTLWPNGSVPVIART